MQNPLTYGFLIPPWGEAIKLDIASIHYDYTRQYIHTKLTDMQKEAFEKFSRNYWKPSYVRQNTPETDFCIQVLGWCQVGTNSPSKVITFTGTTDLHDRIYAEYKSYGFNFNFIPEIKISTLIDPK